jgi:hypothetical protein
VCVPSDHGISLCEGVVQLRFISDKRVNYSGSSSNVYTQEQLTHMRDATPVFGRKCVCEVVAHVCTLRLPHYC